ncbi:methyl-accepting chemotaxis protein [Rhizobium sp. VS19-DR104.2]|uniref:methyl-accepting chemotaxis protein n=1 Tax=unclassified Rhizobium TaxID=2613769 RepID=UPI001CC46A22|nr:MULTISPECIES: HAMP domain-containing methyl-accepting chemotaxis protein [unclassified Rhizobium]MBZ5763532.1 methyl-accepting chemotaxis protein [Rhizobium sp. VS19-DR96]MBZ5769454.1 methyl-accepting chemotaxis protein [Rhizobium sp. VS19-DR129.2]MBZ5777005.1 methyl-accepting chemotaxis protein [Rhizobium sp. VS19-DRK62.2]MBZ5788131.1 methyl-accepting chemotaxis protein [Rhizobium sp. VS19-DR121]MBZ5805580.1 methyl-accepting chemotaxis protein [Rhizobium sp. VS19-DR181]
MKRPTIKTALPSVLLLMGLIFVGFATYAVNQLQAINGNVADIAGNWLPSVTASMGMNVALGDMRVAYRDDVLFTSKEEIAKAEAAIAAASTDFLDAKARYESYPMTDPEVAAIKEITETFGQYQSAGRDFIIASKANNDAQATSLLYQKMNPLGSAIGDDIDFLVNLNAKGAAKSFKDSQSAYSTTLTITYIAIAVALLIIGASIYFAFFGIARPIQAITRSMTHLAAGNTSTEIPFAGRADEIGEMAGAVEVFRQAALSNKRLEQEAEASRLQSESDRVRLTAEAEAAAQQRLHEATAGLASGLRRLAAGELDFQLNSAFAPDFEALRHDLNGAITQLGETLRAVAHAATQIDSGSREISQGTEDLSKRTEQQAASLEETAAALDEITVNVSNSSKRAEEARGVAGQANTSAAHSGKVVADAVGAMQKIEQSSNQVSNIIGVIDEIAFQTNLLALNAGVEAARAGDAGKGFAVVAQEVRELAQRSAQAAKEIKELIRNSSVEVQSGVRLVSETGEALKTIESFIVTVNQHMDAIATSAREQAVALAEVNTAVNQMDQVTQQNAAMVEESNAASARLAGESRGLRELLSQFQLGGNMASQTAVLRQTASAMAAPRRASPSTNRAALRGSLALKSEAWEEF